MPHAFPLFITTRNIFLKGLKSLVVVKFTSIKLFIIEKEYLFYMSLKCQHLFYWHFCTSLIKFKVIIMQQGNEHLIAFVKNVADLK